MKTKKGKGYMLKNTDTYKELAHSDREDSLRRYKNKKYRRERCAIVDLTDERLVTILEASM